MPFPREETTPPVMKTYRAMGPDPISCPPDSRSRKRHAPNKKVAAPAGMTGRRVPSVGSSCSATARRQEPGNRPEPSLRAPPACRCRAPRSSASPPRSDRWCSGRAGRGCRCRRVPLPAAGVPSPAAGVPVSLPVGAVAGVFGVVGAAGADWAAGAVSRIAVGGAFRRARIDIASEVAKKIPPRMVVARVSTLPCPRMVMNWSPPPMPRAPPSDRWSSTTATSATTAIR